MLRSTVHSSPLWIIGSWHAFQKVHCNVVLCQGSSHAELWLQVMGLPCPHVVAQQSDPDPDFPTVVFPNPEEGKGTWRLAFETGAACFGGPRLGTLLLFAQARHSALAGPGLHYWPGSKGLDWLFYTHAAHPLSSPRQHAEQRIRSRSFTLTLLDPECLIPGAHSDKPLLRSLNPTGPST